MNAKELQRFIDNGMVSKILVSKYRVKIFGLPETNGIIKAFGNTLQTRRKEIMPSNKVLPQLRSLYDMGFQGPYEFDKEDPFWETTIASEGEIEALAAQNVVKSATVEESDDFNSFNVVIHVATDTAAVKLKLKSSRSASARTFYSERLAHQWITRHNRHSLAKT
jgi:hypothetical protein